MKICPKCHTIYDDDSQNFCNVCGTRLIKEQEAKRTDPDEYMVCPRCGKHYPVGQVFCPDDGAKLEHFIEADTVADYTAPVKNSGYTPGYDTDQGLKYDPGYDSKQSSSGKKKRGGSATPIIIGILAGALCAIIFLVHSGIIHLPFGNNSSSSGNYVSSGENTENENNGNSGEGQTDSDSTQDGQTNIGTTEDNQNTSEEETKEESSPVSNMDTASIYNAVKSFAGDGTFSFAVVDMSNGTVVGSENMQDMQSASAIIDVPILYTAMKSVENGSLKLSDQVTFTYEVDGRGELKQSDSGNTYSLEDLLSYMLHYSDNNATNSLLNYLSYDTINNICAENGYSVNIVQKIGKTDDYTSNDNYLSAEDTAKMLCEIWNSDTEINKNFLSKYMVIQDSTRTAGIGRNLDSGDNNFLNFNAVKKDKYNEVAIVESSGNTYGIIFFGNHGKLETLEDAAAALGNEVYNEMP